MRFFVQSFRGPQPKLTSFPCALLVENNWDDYGYRTTFFATLYLSINEPVPLGELKIMHVGQERGATPLPGSDFPRLGQDYASLGGKLEYYQTLHALGEVIYGPYLRGLRDVAFDDTIKARVEDLEAFRVSLLRFAGAERTIHDTARIFSVHVQRPRVRNTGFVLKLKTSITPASNTFSVKFDFTRHAGLPNRINVLIGYNGTGKTRLLSNLAIVATGYGYASKEAMSEAQAGRFFGNPPPFRSVIVVSYSAFDTFAIPGQTEVERARLEEEGDIFGYVYCGLRERVEAVSSQLPDEEAYRLRTPRETEAEFMSAFHKVRQLDRLKQYAAALGPLQRDASFQRVGFTALSSDWSDEQMSSFFRQLSSGHKIVLKIITELTAHMDGAQPTLVLVDEPETHLHPPLLSSLLRSLRACLAEFDAFAIVATHSPVVLQETPSRYVRVLKRFGNIARVATPSIETFGESIGVITQEVFNLDESSADWAETLERIAKKRDIFQIEKALKRKLGFAARSQVASLRADTAQ